VLSRRSKATFNHQFFGPATRAFADAWDGSGVDHDVVDADRLRQEWLADCPDGRTMGLLQEAWLVQHSSVGGASA
jgi:asparagine synthase (glutamine-hydrolysing)